MTSVEASSCVCVSVCLPFHAGFLKPLERFLLIVLMGRVVQHVHYQVPLRPCLKYTLYKEVFSQSCFPWRCLCTVARSNVQECGIALAQSFTLSHKSCLLLTLSSSLEAKSMNEWAFAQQPRIAVDLGPARFWRHLPLLNIRPCAEARKLSQGSSLTVTI